MSSGNDDNLNDDLFNFDDDQPLADLPEPDSIGDGDFAGLGDTLPEPDDAPVIEPLDGLSTGSAAADAGGKDKKKGLLGRKKDKKAKKVKEPKAAKPKREKKPRAAKKPKQPREKSGEPMGVAGMTTLAFLVLAILLVGGANAYAFMTAGLASIMFFVLLNIFGLVIIAIPLVCWMQRGRYSPYELFLGLTVVAICVVGILLLVELSRYNGELKATAMLTNDTVQSMIA